MGDIIIMLLLTLCLSLIHIWHLNLTQLLKEGVKVKKTHKKIVFFIDAFPYCIIRMGIYGAQKTTETRLREAAKKKFFS